MNGLNALVNLQRARDAAFSLIVAKSFAEFGTGSRILLPTRLSGAERIAIGKKVLIGASSWLTVPLGALDAQTAAQLPDDGPRIVIGDRVRMNQTSISAVSRVVIGEGAALARGVYISDHSHSFDDPHTPIRDQPIGRIAPVTIERGAWIAQNAVILPGVTVGAGSVVGANSVVREDVPPRTVVAGAPARVIRTLPA